MKGQKEGSKPRTRKERLEVEKRRANYVALAIIAVVMVAIGTGAAMVVPGWLSSGGNTGTGVSTNAFDPVNSCNGGQPLVMHIHVRLYIVINGIQQLIPANIGISPTCEHAIHTHDESGEIHVESPVQYDFHLKHFFQIWRQPFSRDNIMGTVVDAGHLINFTVNNQASLDYENLVLRDGQRIVIEYMQKPSSNLVLTPPEMFQPSIQSKIFDMLQTSIPQHRENFHFLPSCVSFIKQVLAKKSDSVVQISFLSSLRTHYQGVLATHS